MRQRTMMFAIQQYFSRHLQAAVFSLGRICGTPLASLLTISVIGIALTLPSGLYVLVQNTESMTQGLKPGTQISLFLKIDTSEQAAKQLTEKIKSRENVGDATYISPAEGLKTFTAQSEFADALQQLPSNPLPPVIEVYPSKSLVNAANVEQLVNDLKKIPEVDAAQLDMQWLQRFYALMQLAGRAVNALMLLFSMAVLLVVGNTIRLATENRRKEIEVIKLIGGKDAFIRRPFLYTGMFYGLFGAILACIIMILLNWTLASSLDHLTDLYQAHITISEMGFATAMKLILMSAALGLLGAWFTVNRQLSQIEPM